MGVQMLANRRIGSLLDVSYHRNMGTYGELFEQANRRLEGISETLFISIPERLDNLVFEIVKAVQNSADHSKGAKIALMTLLRVKQDAHVIRLLLGQGYVAQAATIASNSIELAYDLLYIRNDVSRINKWENHFSMESVWKGVGLKDRMMDGLKHIGMTESDLLMKVDTDMEMYKILCAAKHSNPMYAKWIGGTMRGGKVFTAGPHVYELNIERSTAVYVMYATARAVDIICRASIDFNLPAEEQSFILHEIDKLFHDVRQAVEQAMVKVDSMQEAPD